MGWVIAPSLAVLRSEIDALYPGRSRVTDGVISGYPGSISSHNANSAGYVCALDVTVGAYPGGITPEQADGLVERVRVALRDQPRGIPAYIIYNRRIATANTNWAWEPYGGIDPHTNHFHVSVDHDIPAGGAPSGQADYMTRAPWLAPTTQGSTITPIAPKEDTLSAAEVDTIMAGIASMESGIRKNLNDHFLYGTDSTKGRMPGATDMIRENQRRINAANTKLAALEEVIAQLAKGQGVSIDYKRIEAAIKAALADGIEITGEVTVGGKK